MYKFHASIHGHTPEKPLSITFEQATIALQKLERLFIEPDGSFVWTGEDAGGEPWQVDGNLMDRGDALAYVEIKGRCPEKQFDRLLTALGWPQSSLAFFLPQRGAMLTETEFRKLAASPAGAT